MDGVLEGAAVLCVGKLACSLLFLPSVTASFSPVSFCCCCLLIFTDLLVTMFLTLLWIAESWLPQLSPLSDGIALRFLLFLSHTYGAVLLLTTPLIAMETLTRLLWPHTDPHRTVDEEGHEEGREDVREGALRQSDVGEVTTEATDEGSDTDRGSSLSYVIGYLCCLSVWIGIGLNVKWGWKLEEVWAAACMHATDSLIGCLPSLLSSPMPSTLDPCWGMVFLSLPLLLTMGMGLHRRHQAHAPTHMEQHGPNNDSNNRCQNLVPALSGPSNARTPGLPVSEQSVDSEKTQSSCTVHRACSWNSVQMSPRHHADFVLLSPERLSAEWGGQAHERTKRGALLALVPEERVASQCRSPCRWPRWGFPCLGVNIMTGFVGVLSVFVLPLNLSVNILLIRTVETMLEVCIRSLVSLQQIQNRGQSLTI